ncbi:GNAT family N-acetyltransferase [Micromonospora sp. SL1-18]|uniref:GNAT family N-acetyltransferase n=1 Tax=Micromonospora sp. SL1-18 TaxID=3399128 RepID=UPI003A4D90FC
MFIRPSEPRDYQQMADILDAIGHDQEAWDYRFDADVKPSFPSWVALDGQRVVGMIEGRFDGDYDERFEQRDHPSPQAWIYLIGVRSGVRRQGIGRALLRFFTEQAVQAGCSFLALLPDQSDDDVPDRVAFFRACGLVPLLDDDPNDVHGAPLPELLPKLT